MVVLTSIISCKTMEEKTTDKVKYPVTKKVNVPTTYFGTQINDPYRWLEDDMSAETAAWVKAENEVTFNYLDQIPFRKALKERMEKLWNYEKISAPFKEGDFTYFYKKVTIKS